MNEMTLDLKGLKCPMPILHSKKALAKLESGTLLTVLATDVGAPDDFVAFCQHTGHELLSSTEQDGVFTLVIRRK